VRLELGERQARAAPFAELDQWAAGGAAPGDATAASAELDGAGEASAVEVAGDRVSGASTSSIRGASAA